MMKDLGSHAPARAIRGKIMRIQEGNNRVGFGSQKDLWAAEQTDGRG
jgi:hypothetical protein